MSQLILANDSPGNRIWGEILAYFGGGISGLCADIFLGLREVAVLDEEWLFTYACPRRNAMYPEAWEAEV
jgi:hypothetical protein